MNELILRYSINHRAMITRNEQTVLNSGAFTLTFPTNSREKVSWFEKRGSELEKTLDERDENFVRGMRRSGRERDEAITNAHAALEMSRAFEAYGFTQVARIYERVSEKSARYAAILSDGGIN